MKVTRETGSLIGNVLKLIYKRLNDDENSFKEYRESLIAEKEELLKQSALINIGELLNELINMLSGVNKEVNAMNSIEERMGKIKDGWKKLSEVDTEEDCKCALCVEDDIEQLKTTIGEYERITNALLGYIHINNEELCLLEFLHNKSMAEPQKFNGDDYQSVLDWLQCQGN